MNKKFRCPICKKTFYDQLSLNSFMAYRASCPGCGMPVGEKDIVLSARERLESVMRVFLSAAGRAWHPSAWIRGAWSVTTFPPRAVHAGARFVLQPFAATAKLEAVQQVVIQDLAIAAKLIEHQRQSISAIAQTIASPPLPPPEKPVMFRTIERPRACLMQGANLRHVSLRLDFYGSTELRLLVPSYEMDFSREHIVLAVAVRGVGISSPDFVRKFLNSAECFIDNHYEHRISFLTRYLFDGEAIQPFYCVPPMFLRRNQLLEIGIRPGFCMGLAGVPVSVDVELLFEEEGWK